MLKHSRCLSIEDIERMDSMDCMNWLRSREVFASDLGDSGDIKRLEIIWPGIGGETNMLRINKLSVEDCLRFAVWVVHGWNFVDGSFE